MTGKLQAAACVTLFCFCGAEVAQARGPDCATAAEVSAIQISAIQQELTDAALACGPHAVAQFNRFQTMYRTELRRSDARLLAMFKRLKGNAAGNAAYDQYKTRAIAHAEQRRTVPGEAANFCKTADLVFDAAFAPDKPKLADFVAGIPVDEESPVDSCTVKVAVGLAGLPVAPTVTPMARPALPTDTGAVPAAAAVPKPAVR